LNIATGYRSNVYPSPSPQPYSFVISSNVKEIFNIYGAVATNSTFQDCFFGVKIEYPERYSWWLNELGSLGISTLDKIGLTCHGIVILALKQSKILKDIKKKR
jgi:hypothetical protein